MISVIIPAYNAQAYLRDCLESVLAQTYTDWEAIIVDDGSTDSTASIALEYAGKDKRFRVVSTPNQGVSSARNLALDMSKGEWITFLDSDDLLPENALERYVANIGQGIDIISGETGCCGQTQSHKIYKNRYNKAIYPNEALKSGLYQTGISASVWAKLYNRKVVKTLRFPENMRYEDLVFFCRVFMQAKRVAEIEDVVYIYRNNPSSFIHNFTPDRLDALRATEMIEGMCESDPGLLPAARDRRLSANFNIFGLLCVHDKLGQYAAVKEQCWQLIKSYRLASLRNPEVRLKNKLGILVSYIGKVALAIISRIVYS